MVSGSQPQLSMRITWKALQIRLPKPQPRSIKPESWGVLTEHLIGIHTVLKGVQETAAPSQGLGTRPSNFSEH